MTLNPAALTARLRAHATGLHRAVAAVDLLADHGIWIPRLTQHNLLSTRTIPPGGAYIDWDRTLRALADGYLPCSASEASILKIAASIGYGEPIDLGSELTGLDAVNTGRVSRAIRATTGHIDDLSFHGDTQ